MGDAGVVADPAYIGWFVQREQRIQVAKVGCRDARKLRSTGRSERAGRGKKRGKGRIWGAISGGTP